MLRRLLLPLIFGIAGVAILVSLGVWQVQRLAWKGGVLAEIERRIDAAPEPLPADPDPRAHRFQPVELEGRIGSGEILIQSSLKLVGAGYKVIAPFETTGGRRVLIDRGFIPADQREGGRDVGQATVVGNLHWPDEVDLFTPEPDRAGGLWFARDVPSLSDALGTEPVLVVVRASTVQVPVLTRLPLDTAGIPNNHRNYAITWFLLAFVWGGMTLFYILQARPSREGS